MLKTRIKLKVDDPQEIKKISHQKSRFKLLLEETTLSDSARDIISKEEYVINPAKDCGIGFSLM